MINKNHKVSIVVSGEELDLYSQDELDLRMNVILYDPTVIIPRTGEYSYSFQLPPTKRNNKILGYGNILSQLNKFSKNFYCYLYSDGELLFEGTLRISEITKEGYECNLVAVKDNDLQKIFGDDILSNITWKEDFSGTSTINSVNNDLTSDYYFPLVSYGVFQKSPQAVFANSIDAYTSKFLLDKYVRWYWETFSPSLKLVEVVKRVCESKGYTAVGDIFNNDIVNNIYLSTNIAENQKPIYNIGKEEIGNCEVNFSYSRGATMTDSNRPAIIQTLTHKYEGWIGDDVHYNFDTVYNYDVFTAGEIANQPNEYIWRENCIVVPADGLYKITLSGVDLDISSAADTMSVYKWTRPRAAEFEQTQTTLNKSFDNYPIELHLVKNEDDVELIKGQKSSVSLYPHEKRMGTSNRTTGSVGRGDYSPSTQVPFYTTKTGEPICYDPWVNSNFICGFSSISNGPAYIKNGYSWNPENNDYNNSRYICNGYWSYKNNTYTATDFNLNTLQGVTNSYLSDSTATRKTGRLQMVVELKKNDVLTLKAITRQYATNITDTSTTYNDYAFRVSGTLKIEPYSPKVNRYADDSGLGWNTIPTKDRFDTQLDLSQFLNQEVTKYSFIDNFSKAFNQQVTVEGNNIVFNGNYRPFNTLSSFVGIDDRANVKDAITERIEYPLSMAVEYNINEEERGFYISVPNDKVELDDWKDYAFRGYDVVTLTDALDTEAEEVNLTNSYTWYENFTLQEYDTDGNATTKHTLSLPIISKDEYMIDGYKYEESMQQDGKSLPQRWWFRQSPSAYNVTLWNGEEVALSIPSNTYNNKVLSYTFEPNTLLSDYFNVVSTPCSNIVYIEVYLTAQEFNLLKRGSLVKFDDDLYYLCEIEGYDPTGNNKTQLKLIKKII